MAIGFMKRISPEYVLENAIKDVKASGVEGVKPYLTEEAQKKLEKFQTFSDEIGIISTFATGTDGMIKMLIRNLADCEYTVVDIMKGSESAKGIVRFKYEDSMEGTIELSMIKEDKEWRIDKLERPTFDKLDVTITAKM